MPFAANEVLIAPKPLGDPGEIKGLVGDVSIKLGQAFKESYKHTRPVPIAFSKAEKLKDSKKLKGKTGLKWQVRVDSKVKAILFQVSEGAKVLDEATIFDKFKDIVEGAKVINLQGDDDTMKSASSKQANKFNGNAKAKGTYNDPTSDTKVKEKKVDLSAINKKMRIVLCGHGGGPDVKGDKMYKASEFGGRSAKQIVEFLIGEGLASSYKGTIYLSGCHTAAGYKDPESFASQVHKLFAAEGYKKLSVAGTPGESWTKDDGDKGSIPSAVSEDLDKTHAKVKGLIAKLETALKTGKKDLSIAEGQMNGFEMQYDTVRQLILDMPPEARDTLEEKLLVPIKKSRDALVPAVLEMRQANTRLEGAIKSEKAYLVDLEKLRKDKKKLLAGKISQSDYNRKEEELFTVEEWWGHFGPAKSTTVKLSKGSSGFDKLIKAFKAKFKK
jgi:hypothetical protein